MNARSRHLHSVHAQVVGDVVSQPSRWHLAFALDHVISSLAFDSGSSKHHTGSAIYVHEHYRRRFEWEVRIAMLIPVPLYPL